MINAIEGEEQPTPATGLPWPCCDNRQAFAFDVSKDKDKRVVFKTLMLYLDGKVAENHVMLGNMDVMSVEKGVSAFETEQEAIAGLIAFNSTESM